MINAVKYPVHLCQPDENKSCGACCGLYNWEDHLREVLESLLEKRTELFLSLDENADLAAYRSLSGEFPFSQKLCETIYNCEFLGFTDTGKKRVGCLLHPVLHHGVDLRRCSFYGEKMCDEHFCPSFTSLTEVEQKAVVVSLDDWYLYGLVITDIDLVKEFFHKVQNRLGDRICLEKLGDANVQAALRDFFGLKEHWKFLSRGKRLGKYYFSQAEYEIARIEYERNWGIKPSQFDRILVSLSSEFKSRDEVREAESIIEDKIRRFIEAYGKAIKLR
jgi:hypothetical protein